MIDDVSTLLTMAEIAAAFAGFSALLTLFSSRDKSVNALQFLRLVSVVGGAIIIIIGALLPIVMARFGLDEIGSWRLAAVLLLFLTWVFEAVLYVAVRPTGYSFSDEPLPARTVVFGLEVLLQGLLITTALGFFEYQTPAVYLLLLTACLVQLGVIFMLMIWSLRPHSIEVKNTG